jgi:hypothetical protein
MQKAFLKYLMLLNLHISSYARISENIFDPYVSIEKAKA